MKHLSSCFSKKAHAVQNTMSFCVFFLVHVSHSSKSLFFLQITLYSKYVNGYICIYIILQRRDFYERMD